MWTPLSPSSLTLLLSLVLPFTALSTGANPLPASAAPPSSPHRPVESNRPHPGAGSGSGSGSDSGTVSPPPLLIPQRLFSSNRNSTFKALPPMSNPNRPIFHSNPSFIIPSHGVPKDDGGIGQGRMTNQTDEKWSSERLLPSIVRVDGENNMFYDDQGRVRLFRGMAISYKVSPYAPGYEAFHPVSSFSDDDLRLFDKLNLNIIRFGISWAAVQPQRGPKGFDMNYLNAVKDMVQRAAQAGIYVLIECHQDLFAEKFMGDGAPAWAITRDWNTLPFPMPIHGLSRAKYDPFAHVDAAPTNMNYSDFWGFEYASDAVSRAFWGLYTNYDGVQDEFIRFWGKIAETFNGMSNVIGYEIMNEPFIAARSTLHVPLSWLTRSNTDKYYLQPMYDRIEAEIRRYDDESLIFWEPVCGSGGDLGDGFTKTPGDRPEKSVFSFHSYGPNAIDSLTMNAAVEKGVYQAKRLKTGMMMTEWDVEYVQGPRRLRRVLELADTVKLSWIGWQYKQFVRVAGSPPHGTLIDPHTGVYRPGMCRLFSRPFPTAVSGELLSFNFNWTTSDLTVRALPPPNEDGEIVISVTEEDEWGWDGKWHVSSVSTADGERIGTVRVEKQEDLEKTDKGVRWWVEKAWVEGSKLVKIRLGKEWKGEAEIVVGMRDRAAPEKIQAWDEAHQEWNSTTFGWAMSM